MKQIIATDKAPGAIGPYSQATKAGQTIYVSGQLPIDPATGAMPDSIEEQTRQSLSNMQAILASEGYSMDDVVKTTVLLADMSLFAPMNGVYATFFSEGMFPARSAFAVKELPKSALVEIECIAAK